MVFNATFNNILLLGVYKYHRCLYSCGCACVSKIISCFRFFIFQPFSTLFMRGDSSFLWILMKLLTTTVKTFQYILNSKEDNIN